MLPKRIKFPLAILILQIICSISAVAQLGVANEKVYKVDTLTRTITEAVEFDKPLYISTDFRFSIQPISLGFASYRNNRQKLRGKGLTAQPVDTFAVSKINDKKYTLLIRLPGLSPGRFHVVSANRKLNDSEAAEFSETIQALIKAKKTSDDIALKMLARLDEKGYVSYGDEEIKIDLKKGLAKLVDSVEVDLKKIKMINGEIDSILKKLQIPRDRFWTSELSRALYQCELCKNDGTIIFSGQRISTNLNEAIDLLVKADHILTDNDTSLYQSLLQGDFSLVNLTQEVIIRDSIDNTYLPKKKSSPNALENLKITITKLELLLSLSIELNRVTSFPNPAAHITKSTLESLLIPAYAVRILMESKEKLNTKIRESIKDATIKDPGSRDMVILAKTEFLDGTTHVFDFTTRNTLQITPEFGMVYYGLDDLKSDFSGPMPYVGFHINFRYIQRSIPFRIAPYKWTVGARLSAFVGFTLASVQKADERKDFFNTTSLLLGMGFRLGNAVRIVGGTMLFQHDDPNPVITNYSYATSPFLGLSLDLSLYDLMKGVNTIFGALK